MPQSTTKIQSDLHPLSRQGSVRRNPFFTRDRENRFREKETTSEGSNNKPKIAPKPLKSSVEEDSKVDYFASKVTSEIDTLTGELKSLRLSDSANNGSFANTKEGDKSKFDTLKQFTNSPAGGGKFVKSIVVPSTDKTEPETKVKKLVNSVGLELKEEAPEHNLESFHILTIKATTQSVTPANDGKDPIASELSESTSSNVKKLAQILGPEITGTLRRNKTELSKSRSKDPKKLVETTSSTNECNPITQGNPSPIQIMPGVIPPPPPLPPLGLNKYGVKSVVSLPLQVGGNDMLEQELKEIKQKNEVLEKENKELKEKNKELCIKLKKVEKENTSLRDELEKIINSENSEDTNSSVSGYGSSSLDSFDEEDKFIKSLLSLNNNNSNIAFADEDENTSTTPTPDDQYIKVMGE